MNVSETVSCVEAMTRRTLSGPRFEHCRATAVLAGLLCERFGEKPVKGFIAGLAHDAARETGPSEIIRLCGSDGLPISGEEMANPILLHGRAAAVMVTRDCGCGDPDVLQAIRDHVTGRPSMGPLSRILFVSDFLEPTREFIDKAFRERMLSLDLDAMVLAVLERKIQFVRCEGGRVTPESEILHKELLGNVR
jgi:predicted HD superfamily hydrolase involved in NAD metabolism